MQIEDDQGWKNRLIGYFVVCGLGHEIRKLHGKRTDIQAPVHGVAYRPSLLDHYPRKEYKKFPLPPHIELFVLPRGIEFYDRGPYYADESSLPKSYSIVLTESDGKKVYVSVVTFRDPVEDDVAESYSMSPKSYVDKCICIVSYWPYFQVFKEALEEIHRICFSSSGCSKPLWEIIETFVNSVPLPSPSKNSIIFAVENSLLYIQSPPWEEIPSPQLSFQCLVECLDIDNIIRLFTALILERKILLRASKYELLTTIAEVACRLIYPFKWMFPYIPVLPANLSELFDAPGTFFFGLSTSITKTLPYLEGIIVVDLDNNKVMNSTSEYGAKLEELPPIPEPELGQLRMGLLELIHPNLLSLGHAKTSSQHPFNENIYRFSKPWGQAHERKLCFIFFRFFLSILQGYRDFCSLDLDAETGRANLAFDNDGFLRARSRRGGRSQDPFLISFLETSHWRTFAEGSLHGENAFFNRLCDAGPDSELPPPIHTKQIISISDASTVGARAASRYTYDRFPSTEKVPEKQKVREEYLKDVVNSLKKPQGMLVVSSTSIGGGTKLSNFVEDSSVLDERKRMVEDIKLKLARLWDQFLLLPQSTEINQMENDLQDPLSSSQYFTLHAMIASDTQGIEGAGFVECLIDSIQKGWSGLLKFEHFEGVKELMILTISKASSRKNMNVILQALEVSVLVHKVDDANLKDVLLRHLGVLPIWVDEGFWEFYLDYVGKNQPKPMTEDKQIASLLESLIFISLLMAELSLVDSDAWAILEGLANNRLNVQNQIVLRGKLADFQQKLKYFAGIQNSSANPNTAATTPKSKPNSAPKDNAHSESENHEAVTVPGGTLGRNWVSNMFRPGAAPQQRGRRQQNENDGNGDQVRGSSRGNRGGVQRLAAGVKVLRGHKQAITALHCATRAEMGDGFVDNDDAGFFVSGSTDTTVKLWDPSVRGSELKSTMSGHKAAVRCLTSDKTRIISGGDDCRVLVFDKSTARILSELVGHEGSVTCVRMLGGSGRGSILSAGHDGHVKIWDTRTDQIASTIARWNSPILAIDYLDHASVLAAAGMDGICHVWDVRAGKERYKLGGHTNWIRSVKMMGDAVVTGSDDWTARIWTLNDGNCEAVLTCHAGPVTSLEYCASSKGIITGSRDNTVRLWERGEGTLRCVQTVYRHSSPILSVKASERWLAIAAEDNSMSLFYRNIDSGNASNNANNVSNYSTTPPIQGSKNLINGVAQTRSMADFTLLRTLNRAPDLVHHVACDVDRGRICSGSRNGVLRVWEPPSPSGIS